MGRRPRNSQVTDVRVAAILDALRFGCTRRAASGAAGISHATFYRMLDEDATLRDEVEKAEAEAERTYTSVVAQASGASWQAAAWWLERRKHEDYARREKVDMTVDLRREAERIAADSGLDPALVIAEAERVLAGG